MLQAPVHIAIFASGGGSNAKALMHWFSGHPDIRISLVVSNNPQAGVLEIARQFAIPSVVISRSQWKEADYIMPVLEKYKIHFIALAGFLQKLPASLVGMYYDKITNIHPSLLPAYGGKGMYGHHVHEAVFKQREKMTGMTIHLVNEHYDEGRILFQATVPVLPDMQSDDIASAVLVEEHRNYAPVMEDYIYSLF